MPSIRTFRDHVLERISSTPFHLTLVLLVFLLIAFSTGISTVYQLLLQTPVGHARHETLIIALAFVLLPVQGLTLLYSFVRDRPRARLLCLAIMLSAVVGCYLVFLSGWWQGQALRKGFLPYIFSLLFKDILLSAYVGCLLWDLLRRTKIIETSPQTGGSR